MAGTVLMPHPAGPGSPILARASSVAIASQIVRSVNALPIALDAMQTLKRWTVEGRNTDIRSGFVDVVVAALGGAQATGFREPVFNALGTYAPDYWRDRADVLTAALEALAAAVEANAQPEFAAMLAHVRRVLGEVR